MENPVRALGARLSPLIGVTPDECSLVVLLYLSIPLAGVFPWLPPSTKSRLVHVVAAAPSYFYLVTVLGLSRGFWELVAACYAVWVVARLGRRTNAGAKMPWLVFAFVMTHMLYTHVKRHVAKTPVTEIEISSTQMVMCIKLISFAWSVYDGGRPDAELDATQRASALREVPDLISFMGYCLFFPSILAGPGFTMADYQRFTAKELKDAQGGPSAGRRRSGLKRFVVGAFFMAFYGLLAGKFSYTRMADASFAKQSLLYRMTFMQVAGLTSRTKYYGAWCTAEAAYIVSGFGFNPATGKWDARRNVRIRAIEFAPNLKVFIDSWNICTNVWLRECVYKRVASPGKKPGFKSTQITFITSAIWHGVNPCYLMTFVLAGFFQSLARAMRRNVRPFFLPPGSSAPRAPPKPFGKETSTEEQVPALAPTGASKPEKEDGPRRLPAQSTSKWAYDIAGWVCSQLTINFVVAPFMLLHVADSIAAWRAVHYYGIWMCFVPLVALRFAQPSLQKAIKARNAQAAPWTDAQQRAEDERLAHERRQDEKRRLRDEDFSEMFADVTDDHRKKD